MCADNIVFDEHQVTDIRVHGQNQSLDNLCAKADEIWVEVRKSEASPETRFKEIRAQYPDFAHTFPLPFRCIVELKQYRRRAFRAYLKQYHVMLEKSGGMWKSREEFLANQAEYLVAMYRDQTPRWSAAMAKQIRENAVESMLKDDKEFHEQYEEADKEAEKLAQDIADARRKTLFQYLQRRNV